MKYPAFKFAVVILFLFCFLNYLPNHFFIKILSYFGYILIFQFITIFSILIFKKYKAVEKILLFILILIIGFEIYFIHKINTIRKLNYNFETKKNIIGTITYIKKDRYFIIEDIVIDNKKYDFKCISFQTGFQPNYYDRIKISGILSNLDFPKNYYLFDFNDYLINNNVFFNIEIESVIKLEDKSLNYIHKIKSRINQRFKNSKTDNFIRGILLGDKSNIDLVVIENFRQSGILHILAISGLHIGILTFGLLFILKLFYVNKSFSILITSLFLISYLIILDYRTTVFRAVVMILLFLWSKELNRKYIPLNIISVAFLIIVFIKPSELFTPGFQLSFAAVLSIFYIFRPLYDALSIRIFKKIIILFLMSFSILIGTAPILTHHFNFISLHSVWANIPVIFCAAIIIPVGFIYFFFLILRINILVLITERILEFFIIILESTASLASQNDFFFFNIRSYNPVYYILFYFVIYILIFKNKMLLKKIICLVIIFLVVIISEQYIIKNSIKINVFDSYDNEFYTVRFYGDDILIIENIDNFSNMYNILKELGYKKRITRYKYIVINDDNRYKKYIKNIFKGDCINHDIIFKSNNETINFVKTEKRYSVLLETPELIFLSFGLLSYENQKKILKNYKINNKKDIIFKLTDNGSINYNNKEIIKDLNVKYLVCQASKYNKYNLPSKRLLDDITYTEKYITKYAGNIIIYYFKNCGYKIFNKKTNIY